MKAHIVVRHPGFSLETSFGCANGELLALVGPSGAGKTTILRCLAGLDSPAEGMISHNGELWFDSNRRFSLAARKRRIGLVFQDFPLFPHVNVLDNVTFARPDRSRAMDLLDSLGIRHLAKRGVHSLSGGERQRVALAQVLQNEPNLLLLDEPFSALDRPTSRKLRHIIEELKKRFCLPVILVTHEPEDVECLADRVVFVGRAVREKEWLDGLRCSVKSGHPHLKRPLPSVR